MEINTDVWHKWKWAKFREDLWEEYAEKTSFVTCLIYKWHFLWKMQPSAQGIRTRHWKIGGSFTVQPPPLLSAEWAWVLWELAMLIQLLSLSTEACSTSPTLSIKELSACQLSRFHSEIKQPQVGQLWGSQWWSSPWSVQGRWGWSHKAWGASHKALVKSGRGIRFTLSSVTA